MTPTKKDLQDMIGKDADTMAARILIALPDDPDCREAFDQWRKLQQEIFQNPNPSTREQYQSEQEAFSALLCLLSLSGVEKFQPQPTHAETTHRKTDRRRLQ